jgi:hypothetical protein
MVGNRPTPQAGEIDYTGVEVYCPIQAVRQGAMAMEAVAFFP